VDALVIPPDLAEALAGDETARRNFEALARSHKREYLQWIGDAKRPETRQRRIEETVRMVAQNKKRTP
jgi:uncharacterized protein YdeI (YjbR/CyaY-like superfamily)